MQMIVISLFIGVIALFISIGIMRVLPAWQDKPYLSFWKLPVAISFAMGVGLSLIGRGYLIQYSFGFLITGFGFAGALHLFIWGKMSNTPYKKVVARWICTSILLQLFSMPSGALIQKWDIHRGMSWCERLYKQAPQAETPETIGPKPFNVTYNYDNTEANNYCSVTDGSTFLGQWSYYAPKDKWVYED